MGIKGLDAWLTRGPHEDEYPCDICGNSVDDCICPECPECGTVGDPLCYKEHGLIRSNEQVESLAKWNSYWEEQNRLENEYYEKYCKPDEELWDDNN
jgi:hypothetical protein